MIPQLRIFGTIAVCLNLAVVAWSAPAWADPPTRVARLSYLSGTVSFDPAGTQDWAEAQPNRPLTTGDSLWADQSSRAELNTGRAVFRIDSETSITLTNLDDTTAQLQLAQGTMTVTVRRLLPDEIVEIDTPNLAFSITQPGFYRLNVAGDGSSTLAMVRGGQANVTGEGRAYTISANASYSFTGTDLSNSTYYDVPAPDDFDRFAMARDAHFQHATAARYVSPDMIGYEDLDDNGSWREAEGYGQVWVPSHVDPGWAPYRDGHWAWVDPWGWTWVDAAPWGFAPFHYGRWVQVGPTWGWIPGPVAVAPVYAPALVAFVGGGIGVGIGVGWFPLGPREIYRPAYAVSPEYVRNVNVSNTNVTNTYVTTVVNNNTTVVKYVNQSAPGAVTAVSQSAFAGGQNVSRALVPVSREALANAHVTNVAAVAPTAHSLAPSAPARARPAPQILSRAVVARTAPPAAPVSFAAKQQQLAANPGRPLEPQAEASLRARPAATAGAAVHPVTVVNAPRPQVSAPAGAPTRPATPPARAESIRPETEARPAVPRPPQPGAAPRTALPEAAPAAPSRPEAGRPAEPAGRPVSRPEVSRPEVSRPEVIRPEVIRPEVGRPPEPAAARPEPPGPVEHAPTEARPAAPRPAAPHPSGREENKNEKRE